MYSIKKIFPTDMNVVPEILDFIRKETEELPKKASYEIVLSCEEILTNIASYAYSDQEGDVAIKLEHDKSFHSFTVTFEDGGIPFNPLQWEMPNVKKPFEEKNLGGLGILIVQKTMTNIYYTYADKKNILTIRKVY